MSRLGSITAVVLGGILLLVLAIETTDAGLWFDQAVPTISEVQPTNEVALIASTQGADATTPVSSAIINANTILARPLFNWSRRPTQNRGGGADAPLPRLSGILVSATQRFAIFAAQPGGRPEVVREGGTIGYYTIDTIAADHVILKSGADSQTLRTTFGITPSPPMATPDAS